MAESGFRHIPPEQPSTHGGDTIPVDVDTWERQIGYVLTRLDEIQQRALTPDDITRALQRAIADAASSPDTWAAAVAGARKATESHAGRWLVGSLWSVARKGLVILTLGMLIYSFGGWSALAGVFKSVVSSEP
jgi:hypothetical protein